MVMKKSIEIGPNQYGVTEMWDDKRYFSFTDAVVRTLINNVEIFYQESGKLMTRNSVNIFTSDFGFPDNVSYPREVLAERLRGDATKWINQALEYSPHEYVRTHQTFVFNKDEAYVLTPKNPAHGISISAHRIRVDIGWR
jgi:hypothetical protein